jgi:uncharacterized protein (DUF2147 family)
VRSLKLMLALALCMVGVAYAADPLTGDWLVHAEKGHGGVIRIERNGNCYDGRVVHLESPTYLASEDATLAGKPRLDRFNPDPALRKQPLLGLRVVKCFERDTDGRYVNAELYRPEDGNTYRGKATLSADGNTLEVRGYLGISLLGRSQTWTRVASPEAITASSYDAARP